MILRKKIKTNHLKKKKKKKKRKKINKPFLPVKPLDGSAVVTFEILCVFFFFFFFWCQVRF